MVYITAHLRIPFVIAPVICDGHTCAMLAREAGRKLHDWSSTKGYLHAEIIDLLLEFWDIRRVW